MDSGRLVSDDDHGRHRRGAAQRAATPSRATCSTASPAPCAQAAALEEITSGDPIDVVINLDVPEDVVIERITHRRVCVSCGAIYSVEHPPTNAWDCDAAAARSSSATTTPKRRSRSASRSTPRRPLPLRPVLRERGLLGEVDGLGTPDEVSERLLAVVDRRQRAG